MHKIVHLFFASRIRRLVLDATGISLCRFRFALGNIYPDLTLSMCATPHTIDRSLDLFRRYADELFDQPANIRAFSVKLGIMMHYVCDYFCYVHGKRFSGSLFRHMAYELSMIRTAFALNPYRAQAGAERQTEADSSVPSALSAYLLERYERHSLGAPSALSDIHAALEASEAFCLDAVARWGRMCLEPLQEIQWEDAESAIVF